MTDSPLYNTHEAAAARKAARKVILARIRAEERAARQDRKGAVLTRRAAAIRSARRTERALAEG